MRNFSTSAPLWCYRCGAIRLLLSGPWQKTTGLGGKNPFSVTKKVAKPEPPAHKFKIGEIVRYDNDVEGRIGTVIALKGKHAMVHWEYLGFKFWHRQSRLVSATKKKGNGHQ